MVAVLGYLNGCHIGEKDFFVGCSIWNNWYKVWGLVAGTRKTFPIRVTTIQQGTIDCQFPITESACLNIQCEWSSLKDC